MLKFGKKVTYRPILISFYFTLVPILACIAFDPLLGFLIGLAVFVCILSIYYLPNLPLLFSYWEVDANTIKYNDLTKVSNRLKMVLMPHKNQLKTIQKSAIKSITVNGLTKTPQGMTYAVVVSAAYAVMMPAISMIQNPVSLVLTLKDGQTVELSVSRDYAYHQKETIKKLNQFLSSMDQTTLTDQPNHQDHLKFV